MEELQVLWGWQPALYLFLGGMGGGAFATAAVFYLRDGNRYRKTVTISMWAALVCLCLGLVFLITELINPGRGLMMWQSFTNGTSWMTIGAWILFLAVIVFGLSALLLSLKKPAEDGKAKQGGALRVLVIIGLVLGVFVAVYTGILLSAAGQGVPLWNTVLLPCLFTVSALDTGVALVELIHLATKEAAAEEAGKKPMAKLLRLAVIVLVCLEIVVLVAFLAAMGANGSASAESVQLLTSGALSKTFWWLVVCCGLAVPLLVAVVGLAMEKRASGKVAPGAIVALGALAALAGGCALRFLVLEAGTSVDYLTQAVLSLI